MTSGRLVRNQAGVARQRSQDQSARELSLEAAIAENVRQLRLQAGLSVGDMAQRIGISKAMLSKVENAQTSCSLATLARLAEGFDVPVTSLLRGAETHRPASFVPSGNGTATIRNGSQVGHAYELLGTLRGEHKRLECLQVTLSEESEIYPLFQHPGTEFIYLLEGEMVYEHSGSRYRMQPGDSLQLDGEGAHGPVEISALPTRFLSIIAFPDAML